LAFCNGEAAEDFSHWLQSIINLLATHGITIDDEEAVSK
jgi:hypothetical protein